MESATARMIVGLTLLGAGSLIYRWLNARTARWYPKIQLDDHIPLIPSSVILYILYYPYLLLSFVILAFTASFEPFLVTMGVASVLLWIIWYIYPTGVRRPALRKPKSVWERLLVHLYTFDNDTNALPSGHVVHTVITAYFLWATFPTIASWVSILGTLICISTLLTKQHYLLDVITGVLFSAGILLGVLAWY